METCKVIGSSAYDLLKQDKWESPQEIDAVPGAMLTGNVVMIVEGIKGLLFLITMLF